MSDQHEPDWADAREAARRAGFELRHGKNESVWGYQYRDDQGRIIDDMGWVDARGWNKPWDVFHVSLVGAGPYGLRRSAHLIDPTPADVIAAAQLVKLGIEDAWPPPRIAAIDAAELRERKALR